MRWISEQRDGCYMRWISEQVKARWMLHALDHIENLAAIYQGASYRSRTKRWISEQ